MVHTSNKGFLQLPNDLVYQVQASRFMTQVIVLVIINAMISNQKPYATNNNKKSRSLSHDNKVDKYLLHVHNKILIYQLILYNG